MADLIDRDALLKDMGLTDAVKYGNKDAEQQYRSYSTWMSYEIADAIWDAPAVNRWIPVSERLPVLYVPVMILTDDGSYAIAHVTGNEDEYLWFGDGGHYSKDYVLFWMPLPEPPKEDET